jgi:glucan phosphoethanolaminetransferase (alkaline phosphatase superfamily)
MTPQDELRNLWHSGAVTPGKGEQEMLALVIEKTRAFDRRITGRNVAEVAAGAFVFCLFAFFAWKAPHPIMRLGAAIVALSAVWISYYILRFGAGPKRLDPGMELSRYAGLLRDNYDRQIRLLRRVKYWYLLPPYVGLVIGYLGIWMQLTAEGKPLAIRLASLAGLPFVTLFFAGVWVLNERYGVRHLERLKSELMAVSGEQ